MILVDNRNILRLRDRELLNQLSMLEGNIEESDLLVEPSKAGVPTLKLNVGGRVQYVHSKYDPEKEAERLINQLEGIENSNHILFVGCGLGYHIKEFTERYPNMKFSIYEPDAEVLISYLSNQKLSNIPINNIGKIFTGKVESEIIQEVTAILESSNSMLRIYTLPVYEKIYGSQLDIIMEKALESLKAKRNNLATNAAYQKRWTINSIKNFPLLLKTPNILHDVDKSAFEGKPAIIVAAGPSLNEEFENLRYIKDNRLAYIFSVGSAINALIEHGIYPDAACTYDPSERNQLVIQRIKDDKITDIPLVYGSSVGFETLEAYPGKMLHMITSQDTISQQLLNMNQSISRVMDAPSIAVVTLQLLNQLQCNPIVLVGQNLGFQENKRYAAGIDYDFVENELNEQEQKSTLTVKDVYGKDIQTNEGFNRMREQLELHIRFCGGKEIINTSKGGAQIGGTVFSQLSDLISRRLVSQVVQQGWADKSNSYDIEFTRNKLRINSLSEKECKGILKNAFNQLKKINTAIQLRQSKNMEKRFSDFDREFDKLKQNIFYKGYIEPMVRVQYDILSEEIQRVRFEKDGLKKAEVIVINFNSFLQAVASNLKFVQPLFEELQSRVEKMATEIENR